MIPSSHFLFADVLYDSVRLPDLSPIWLISPSSLSSLLLQYITANRLATSVRLPYHSLHVNLKTILYPSSSLYAIYLVVFFSPIPPSFNIVVGSDKRDSERSLLVLCLHKFACTMWTNPRAISLYFLFIPDNNRVSIHPHKSYVFLLPTQCHNVSVFSIN